MEGFVREHEFVARVAGEADPPTARVIEALSLLPGLRRELDRLERDLIETAREQGLSWARVAAGLGLRSRQAAEQRWLRLGGELGRDPDAVRRRQRRQREVDGRHGKEIVELRAAAVAVHRQMRADRDWDGRHPRAALARTSLEAAVSAEPGGLYALASGAADDLDTMPAAPASTPLAVAVRRLRRALRMD